MEISARKPKTKAKKPGSEQVTDGKLHFYANQPTGNVSIMEFQACAVERLKSMYNSKLFLKYIKLLT